MSGETTVIEGKTFNETDSECIDLPKLNAAAKPSVRVNASSIDTRELVDGAVTVDKLADDVLAQINADAVVSDGSITCGKLAADAICFAKFNQDALDKLIQRNVVASTIGAQLKYVTTTGITEEISPTEVNGNYTASKSTLASGTATVGWTTLTIGTIPTGKTAINIKAKISAENNAAGAAEAKLEIRDSQNNTFELAFCDIDIGNRFDTDTDSSLFDASGSTTMQYRITTSGSITNLDWTIKRWGWI